MAVFLKRFLFAFATLGIIFIPFPFYLFPYQHNYTSFIFDRLIAFFAKNIFHLSLTHSVISSDSRALYILVFVLFVVSIVLSAVSFIIKKESLNSKKIIWFCTHVFTFYLAALLLKYGVDKVFKAQFYLPEPNTLYTSFGQMDKDLLYWSTIGTSRQYNIFLGCTEIIAAALLLFKRVRLAGSLLAIGILINIVAVNFCFDISVKIYSCFLLLLASIITYPYAGSLYRFFIKGKETVIPENYERPLWINKFWYATSRAFVCIIIVAEAFYPYIKTRNLNDDTAARPYLHGAYQVLKITPATDSLLSPVKRIFIHREGYIIFENADGQMQDMKLRIDTINKKMEVTGYDKATTELKYSYQNTDSILTLQCYYNNKEYLITAKALDWKKLPALQNKFHWIADDQ